MRMDRPSRRKGNVLQRHQQRFTFDVGERQIDTARITGLRITVENDVTTLFRDTIDQSVR